VWRPRRIDGEAPITRTTRDRSSFANGRAPGATRPDDEDVTPEKPADPPGASAFRDHQ
jgi:hypothetical protein